MNGHDSRTRGPHPQPDREEPVRRTRIPHGSVWVVTGYEDVRKALVDDRLSVDPTRGQSWPAGQRPWRHLLNMDPPDHTRIRRLVSSAFTVRRVELLRDRIQRTADDLIGRFLADGRAELLEDLAFPLSLTVLRELMGVPAQELGKFRVLTRHASSRQVLNRKLLSYLQVLIDRKRSEPGDDLLSALIAAHDEEQRLDNHELLSTAFLLLAAGYETTANLIAKGMLALLCHPDEMAAVSLAPELLPVTVEELLRYDCPLEFSVFRFPLEPLDIAGTSIPAGETVLLGLASADRDPHRFQDADALDVNRVDNQHLAFGHGTHYCLGAPLARLEGQIAIGTLLARCPDLTLAADPASLRWTRGMIGRTLVNLPVMFRPVTT